MQAPTQSGRDLAARRARSAARAALLPAVATALSACVSAGGAGHDVPDRPSADADFRGSYTGSATLVRTLVAPTPEAPNTSEFDGDGVEVAGDSSASLHVVVISHGEHCALRAAAVASALVIAPDQLCPLRGNQATMRITGGRLELEGAEIALRLHGQVTESVDAVLHVTTVDYSFRGARRAAQSMAAP
jgi:hypothetical protein